MAGVERHRDRPGGSRYIVTQPGRRPVVVIGGGITGLAAAWRLAGSGAPVVVLESGPRLGGKIGTELVEGFRIEAGPDSFITTRPAALELCRELGLGDELVSTRDPRFVYIWQRGALRRIPDGLSLVIPTRMRPVATSPLFSIPEKARMGLDLVLPRGRAAATGADEAAGALLRRRFGDALVERIAGPLLGGIYGTPVDELSVLAVIPQLREVEREHRSLILGTVAVMRARRAAARGGDGPAGSRRAVPAGSPATVPDGPGAATATPPAAPPLFLTLRDGMERLVTVLADRLAATGVELRTSSPVRELRRDAEGWQVQPEVGDPIEAAGVVLAIPAPAAAELVGDLVPDAVGPLRSIAYGSTTAVSLAYASAQLPSPIAGHGFVIADREDLGITASTWTSAKWPDRAPDGQVLVRVSLADVDAPDADIQVAAHRAVVRSLGVEGDPHLVRINRWVDAMPRYTVGHLERVAAIERAVERHAGLAVAGSAYHGVGIPDCISSGRKAADRVLASA